MAKTKLTDSEAKAILRGWPQCPASATRRSSAQPTWSKAGQRGWIRAQPVSDGTRQPRLKVPGSNQFSTQPDGLYLTVDDDAAFVDCIAVEVCGTVQNLNDKRSRYVPTLHSLLVEFDRRWLAGATSRGRNRADYLGLAFPPKGERLTTPVRYLRVLYSLPNRLYESWTAGHVPAGYEFFCPHSSLASYPSQKMQWFLYRMMAPRHFYTQAK